MYLILTIAAMGAFAFATYYLLCAIIMQYKQCGIEQAQKIISDFLSGRSSYQLAMDTRFVYCVEETVEKIIGKNRFESLVALGRTCISCPLLFFGFESGLPYVAVTFPYEDEEEKRRFEISMRNLVVKFLGIHGIEYLISVVWEQHKELGLPLLKVYYALSIEQNCILQKSVEFEQLEMLSKYQDVTDDEDVDLI